ncbi:hypothetical protein NDU88_002190 [Pleurodeles waltl]|uniref:Uncharacterized protein n=1 Tax=Pleurodeles waltl TaxID=8319 RepID=A0AAV7U8Z8_PLEWA|nr:hypothetical protein NDU88_002190 [Pleurodeles waltl]
MQLIGSETDCKSQQPTMDLGDGTPDRQTNIVLDMLVSAEDAYDVLLNWETNTHRTMEWEAVKAVLQRICFGLTCGVSQQLQLDLAKEKTDLAVIQAEPEVSEEGT